MRQSTGWFDSFVNFRSAKSEIFILDPYSGATTLDLLAKKQPGVTVRLVCNDRSRPALAEIAEFNRPGKCLTNGGGRAAR